MDKARETLVERLAQWLHDEVEWPDPDYPACSWPEHADDTGQRGDGYLKLVPQNVCEQFREIARRHPLLSDLTRLKAKVEELERERLKLRTALIETGRNLGAFLADDVSSDFLTLLPEEARLLKARLARAVEVMRRVNPALSAAFQGGMEEREGGSANRQARYMESVDQLRADARAFLSEQENRHGNG